MTDPAPFLLYPGRVGDQAGMKISRGRVADRPGGVRTGGGILYRFPA